MLFRGASSLLLLLLAAVTTQVQGQTLIPPWDKESLRPVLSQCRLQEPESSPTAVANGAFQGYATEKFQLVNNSLAIYQVRNEGKRNELRVNEYFNVADHIVIEADMEIPYPDQFNADQEEGNRHFVFFQSHVKDYLGYKAGPLLTMRYYTSRSDINGTIQYDHLWANVRNELSYEIKTNTYWDCGPRPDGPFHFEVEFVNTKMYIRINGNLIPYFPKDMSYWTPIAKNYLKGGLYLTGWNTSVDMSFDELWMGSYQGTYAPTITARPTISPAPTLSPTPRPFGDFEIKFDPDLKCYLDANNCIAQGAPNTTYAPEENCAWILRNHPVTLSLASWDVTDVSGDYVTIDDGTTKTDYGGDALDINLLDGMEIQPGTIVKWRSDGDDVVGAGFTLCGVRSTDPPITISPAPTLSPTTAMPTTVASTPSPTTMAPTAALPPLFYVNFDNFGDCFVTADNCIMENNNTLYSKSQNCNWKLSNGSPDVVLRVEEFDVIGTGDRVEITQNGVTTQYYGSNLSDGPEGVVISVGDKITFRADGGSSSVATGIKICGDVVVR